MTGRMRGTSTRATLLLCALLLLTACSGSRAVGDLWYDLRNLEWENLDPFSEAPPPMRVDGPTVAETIAAMPDFDLGIAATTAPAGPSGVGSPAGQRATTLAQVISRYREVLPDLPPGALRGAVEKRLTDLELERASLDPRPAAFDEVIVAYERLLREGVDAAQVPALRYQLARARELSGDARGALAELDRLLAERGAGVAAELANEAHFRRAEAAFSAGDYAAASADYAAAAGADSKLALHARYMLGWSRYRAGDPAAALAAMVEVVAALGSREASSLAPSEAELLGDALRAAVLSLERHGGVDALATAMRERDRPAYQSTLYEALGRFYLDGRRFQDAALTFARFEDDNALAAAAPAFALRALAALREGGFPSEATRRVPSFVTRYGVDTDFHRAHGDAGIAPYRDELRGFLDQLAAEAHAGAQRDRSAEQFATAGRWYRLWLTNFDRPFEGETPARAEIGEKLFLYAETLLAREALPEAVVVLRSLVTRMAEHPRAREAGYAAVLALTKLSEQAPAADGAPNTHADALLAAELDFADRFGDDPRAPDVQLHAASSLRARNDLDGAALAAENALQRWSLTSEQQSVARRIAAESRAGRGELSAAETHFAAALRLAGGDAERGALRTRLVAVIEGQATAAQEGADLAAAIGHWQRLQTAAGSGDAAVAAAFNVAALQVQLGQLGDAAQGLQAMRTRYPGHPQLADVAPRLADLFERLERPRAAADEWLLVAANSTDRERARAAHYRAGELLVSAEPAAAEPVLVDYLARFPQPLVWQAEVIARLRELTTARPADSARWRERQIALVESASADAFAADNAAQARVRALAGAAALAIAEEQDASFRALPLTAALGQSLPAKRAALDTAVAAFERAARVGDAQTITVSTLGIGDAFATLADALGASPRPDLASDEGRARYETALAGRVDELRIRAIEVLRINLDRAREGQWDAAIEGSVAALARLAPAVYARAERWPEPLAVELASAAEFNAELPAARDHSARGVDERLAALAVDVELPPSVRAAVAAVRGLRARARGEFAAAAAHYREGLTDAPDDALLWRNLGVLEELYLNRPDAALAAYRRASASNASDAEVVAWIATLEVPTVVSATP